MLKENCYKHTKHSPFYYSPPKKQTNKPSPKSHSHNSKSSFFMPSGYTSCDMVAKEAFRNASLSLSQCLFLLGLEQHFVLVICLLSIHLKKNLSLSLALSLFVLGFGQQLFL